MMKKRSYKVILGACAVAASVLLGSGNVTTQAAAPEKTQALKAYNQLMTKEKIPFYSGNSTTYVKSENVRFALANVDNDGVPELIVKTRIDPDNGIDHSTGRFNIYTFKSGKKKYVRNAADEYSYFPKVGISHSAYKGTSDMDEFFDISNPSLTLFAKEKEKNPQSFGMRYYGEYRELDYDNTISKAEYEKLYRKYTKGVKEKTPAFHKNTTDNRKVYFLGKPGKAKITSLKQKGSSAAVVKIKKAKNVIAYKVQYSTNSKFKHAKSKVIKKTSYKLTKLKRGKTYYVRVCGYKKSGKNKTFGKWSGVKTVTIKKSSNNKAPKKSPKSANAPKQRQSAEMVLN